MLPVQRLYGQTPFFTVPNSHCRSCLGCTKNCYDFNPRVAWLADLHDENEHWTAYRLFFAGAFPGIVIAYFTIPPGLAAWEIYARFILAIAVGVGSFYILHTFVKVSLNKLTALYAASAISIFYWYAAIVLAETLLNDRNHWSDLDPANARIVAYTALRVADVEKGRGLSSARPNSHRGTVRRC